MSNTSPWDEIATPSSDFNVRQVAVKTAVPCFWGRDSSGACLFIVELKGDHVAHYRRNVVTVNGVCVDLRTGDQGLQHLVLALERQVDRDLFAGLCRTLAYSLEHATDAASSLAVSLAHIRRWKTFLSGRSQHLSAEEVQGLFAEVIFLMELLDREMPSNSAVDAWLGPERSHQDFIFGNTAVEVKSLSGVERSSIRISSEDQLESLNDALFLRIYRLSSLADAAGARSLNEIVSVVQSRLDEADAVEAFDRKLVAHGYAPLPNYDEPRFVISDVRSYRVADDFPRLMRSQLPVGITKVAYDIRLEAIAQYECDGVAIFGGK
ncbi:PD-(D/E)XK motif protein [Aeromonas media]|uniref:PD-(D/E)XK motif protein n=1 Tax=Aeromonas media TaxID=651 RepID=A0AAW5RIK0_AERME|nr:PD-(D/E)XK motif protein [Aeromonas media]MCV3286873.1 PD-(D/E)XK motif protein [Aeromonas media]QJT34190.1 PD-(D/E)XK motif protein [Aeromonas media]QJT39767.1 PD-(D/E)XK motif protein [Aeromonas media]